LTDKADYIIKSFDTDDNGSSWYKLIDAKKPYFWNIRLKPFVTSFGRMKTAKVALLNIEKVIRIHTDGLAFSEEQNFEIAGLIPEDKTTGLIEFVNISNYSKIDF
jgi:hypothetical protein